MTLHYTARGSSPDTRVTSEDGIVFPLRLPPGRGDTAFDVTSKTLPRPPPTPPLALPLEEGGTTPNSVRVLSSTGVGVLGVRGGAGTTSLPVMATPVAITSPAVVSAADHDNSAR